MDRLDKLIEELSFNAEVQVNLTSPLDPLSSHSIPVNDLELICDIGIVEYFLKLTGYSKSDYDLWKQYPLSPQNPSLKSFIENDKIPPASPGLWPQAQKTSKKEEAKSRARKQLVEWRSRVLKRDNKCINCNRKSNLQAHHIWSKTTYPDKKLKLNNGVTLCKQCHRDYHNLYFEDRIMPETLNQFVLDARGGRWTD